MNTTTLSKSQLSIWMGQQLSPNVPLYNMAHAFSIKGAIDVDCFNTAFQALLNEADVLRTVYGAVDGVPYQNIRAPFAYTMEYIAVETMPPLELQDWLSARSKINFNLEEGVFDSALLKLGEADFIWFFNVHHIATDATTSTLLLERMSRLYTALKTDTLETIAALPQFADYLKQEQTFRSSEAVKPIQTYWKDKVKAIERPKLYGRVSKNESTAAKRLYLDLGAERSQQLRTIAQQADIRCWTEDLTLFNIFATLLFTYIYRVSGQNTLAIGTPSHNRPTKALKATPGLFVEFFPLVADLNAEASFLDVYQAVKVETNTYLRHAQAGASSADLSKSYNVILNYITAKFSGFDGVKVASEWLHPEHVDLGHALRCHVYDMDDSGEIALLLDLNAEVFPEQQYEAVTSHMLQTIDAFILDRTQSIGQFSMVSDVETAAMSPLQVTEGISKKGTVLDAFEAQVQQTPNAIALQYNTETLTYRGLNRKANQLAYYLVQQGAKPGASVAIHSYRNSNYIVSVLAVLKIGGTFIPIASNQPKDRIAFILEDSKSAFAIVEDRLLEGFPTHLASVVNVQALKATLASQPETMFHTNVKPSDLAYVLYTSGSTGQPKGVLISNKALSNYIFWAQTHYGFGKTSSFALCTAIGFDLTITSTFVPLVSGGRMLIYEEDASGWDAALLDAVKDNKADTIKVTPSHLTLLKDHQFQDSSIRTIIVGGEDFKASLGQGIKATLGTAVTIYNEYGPTEATVGCIVSTFQPEIHTQGSIPIGLPVPHMQAYVLDAYQNRVPQGVVGELYISGSSLAEGYLNLETATAAKFLNNPFVTGTKMYKTGDLVRQNSAGVFEYLGRTDEQVKLRGYRIELPEIEANMSALDGIAHCAVVLTTPEKTETIPTEAFNCVTCGLPSNYPQTDFDAKGVCNLCNAFEGYKDKAQNYFKTEEELHTILTAKKGESPEYDCLTLLSGGKDSTYILAQLVNMGLKVLAFTLDNGYISEQAKGNIERIVRQLNVDHIYGETNHMNEIFVDSLHRHKNVCNGCFKTIYTLSTKIAMERHIPFIVTGLSRGQFFETRLTEELFWDEDLDVTKIDDTILEVRKLYHREDDAVKLLLDVSMFEDDAVFESVKFIDFYRYSDVSLEAMLKYLEDTIGWVRPTDTGRSTNCLINQVGISVHKKERGYSNYSFPYSWDVRLGHKTRDESLEEINEYIDEVEVQRIMAEIGYEAPLSRPDEPQLVAYYTGEKGLNTAVLKAQLAKRLPAYMLPATFKYLEVLPLTKNGKTDKNALSRLTLEQIEAEVSYVAPRNDIETLIAAVWKAVLRIEKIGVHDNFIALGGHSLAAIRVTSRLNEALELEMPLHLVFNLPTIAEYAKRIEDTITALLHEA